MGTHADDTIGFILDPNDEEEWQRLNDEDYAGGLYLETAADAEWAIRRYGIRGPDDPPEVIPECPYCGREAQMVKSSEIYTSNVDYGWMWLCRACDAYVGCHKGSTDPLGTLANASLRLARRRAHAALDPLWQLGDLSRDHVYLWLADEMGLRSWECHIGHMTEAQCERVVNLCAQLINQDKWGEGE